jgi:dipeptide transport system substrate-binding protein
MNNTLLFSILTLAIFSLAGAPDVHAAKTFVYCSEGSPSGFNPQIATDGPSFNASSHAIYNNLVEFKKGALDIVPGLAESCTISKDGLSYIFKLRKGVSFHSNALFKPTRDFNADDVLFSFNRQRLPNHPYNKISGGSYEYFESMDMKNIIKDIVKKDDYTVEFKLAKREAPFLANMAMDFASIFSAEYADKMMAAKTPDKVDTDPVGTGPFVFKSYQKDTMIRYTANEKYFKGKPPIDNLVFSITPDASVRFQKLKTGECHFIAEPAPQDIDAMKKMANITVLEKEGLNVGYLAFNAESGPYKKQQVREAINLALNKKAYLNAIYMNRAMIAKNPIPPSIWSYNDAVVDYEYNPEKAKELLKKAGYPDGFETEMWTLPVSRPYNPSGKKMGEMMQADLAKVGIKVKLITYDWPTYLEKSRKGEHQMIQLGWIGDNGDPDNFFNILLSCNSVKTGSNTARWCNKEFSDLINQAKVIPDVKKRTDLYKKAQVIFKKEAPWVTLAHGRVFRAMSNKVTGYMIHPFGSESFESVDLK